jgi:hypothetical protein
MRRSLPAMFAVVVLAACARGDHITLRGDIVSPTPGDADCTVSLPQLKDAPNAADYVRRVHGSHFQESFAVEQRARDYEVTIACAGHAPVTRTAHFDAGTFAVDLGQVVLEQAR